MAGGFIAAVSGFDLSTDLSQHFSSLCSHQVLVGDESRLCHASRPACSIEELAISIYVHHPGGDSLLTSDWELRPWLAPNEGKRRSGYRPKLTTMTTVPATTAGCRHGKKDCPES